MLEIKKLTTAEAQEIFKGLYTSSKVEFTESAATIIRNGISVVPMKEVVEIATNIHEQAEMKNYLMSGKCHCSEITIGHDQECDYVWTWINFVGTELYYRVDSGYIEFTETGHVVVNL